MIKVITTIHPYHDSDVKDAVKKLQTDGYDVTKLERVSSVYLVMFGNDTTHIHYRRVT